ncbi:hypothetical protein B0H13DRAFT_1871053 [Mycena leptocephala]|nr:hypothetical protein B0H13DRAFT_1871053 [Mycena leptocephala]
MGVASTRMRLGTSLQRRSLGLHLEAEPVAPKHKRGLHPGCAGTRPLLPSRPPLVERRTFRRRVHTCQRHPRPRLRHCPAHPICSVFTTSAALSTPLVTPTIHQQFSGACKQQWAVTISVQTANSATATSAQAADGGARVEQRIVPLIKVSNLNVLALLTASLGHPPCFFTQRCLVWTAQTALFSQPIHEYLVMQYLRVYYGYRMRRVMRYIRHDACGVYDETKLDAAVLPLLRTPAGKLELLQHTLCLDLSSFESGT